ncbi:hypothetical protein [Ancylobacter sp. IITR112]|uniref:hypothetical protein n=1 Tax=Ancylobacter sp. IITR112 TaxID=3138073 RepID=UPI00352A954C
MARAASSAPGCTFPAMASPAAQARWHVRESEAAALPLLRPPAWVFLHGLKSPLSSTQLRAQA